MLLDTASPAVSAGQALLEVERIFGESTITTACSSSPLKLLAPIARGPSVWAYTSNFGGGLVAGDQTRLDVRLGPDTRCYLGSQSSTKVYRNPANHPCTHYTRATLGGDAVLVFTPEPVQAFAASRYHQRQDFYLQRDSGLVLLDWFTSGRAARGERWMFSHLESRNDVFLENQPVFIDPLRLSSAAVPAHMGRFNCFASLLLIGPSLQSIAAALHQQIAARPVPKRAPLAASASPVQDGLLLRLAGESVEAVRGEIQAHLAFLSDLLGDDPWSRKW